MLPFSHYAKIKDFYCICYFGYADEYLVQLRLLKPIFEKHFPGLKIYLGCKDDKLHLLGDLDCVLKISELKVRKHDFAHIKQVQYNGQIHPIEELLIEAEIDNYAVKVGDSVKTTKCVIITESAYPTKPLEIRQIEVLKKMARDRGFEPVLNQAIDNAGLVMGVESVGLFESAARGIETILVPTGIGARLYKNLFPNQVVKNT